MLGRIAFLSDIHFPYQCLQAWSLTLSILPQLNLDGVILAGDILDFEPISKFVEHPRRKLDLRPQLDEGRKQLLRLRGVLRDQWIVYLCGNHEYRLERYIYKRAPELIDINALTIPELLDLNKDDLDIEWYDQIKILRLGKLNATHGDQIKAGGLFPARSIYQKMGCNILVGHYHKFDRYEQRRYGTKTESAWINGCLSSLSPDWTFFPQWQQGFSIIEVSKNGTFHVEQVRFSKQGPKLSATINDREYLS